MGLLPHVHDTWPTNHRTLAEVARHALIVAISRSHARSYGDILVTAVTHHGIDLEIHKRRFSLARMAVGYEVCGCTGSSWNIPAGRRPSGREYAQCDRIRGPGPSLKCFSSRTYTAAISG